MMQSAILKSIYATLETQFDVRYLKSRVRQRVVQHPYYSQKKPANFAISGLFNFFLKS